MWRTLIFLTLRQWQTHRLRLALTFLGIILGVSVYFAMRTANAALLGSLRQTIEVLAGKANLQVTASETGLPEETLEMVRSTPGVAVAEPVIEVITHTALEGGGNLLILGADVTGEQRLREYQFDESLSAVAGEIDYLEGPYALIVSQAFAARHSLKKGDFVPLFTSRGRRDFRVVGTFTPTGVGEVFGGQVAVMDIYAARDAFNRGADFDRIDVMTAPDAPAETVRQALSARLPLGVEVAPPAMRGESTKAVVTTLSQGLLVTSFVALLVGVFLIFNSFGIAVNQQWKDIGVLRALGLESRNVQLMFLVEAALIGALASVAGVGVGFVLAIAANHVMSFVTAVGYGLLSTPGVPEFHLRFALEAFVLGIAASVAAAWIPARGASRLNPALALHNVEARRKHAAPWFTKTPVGVALIVAGLLLIRFTTPRVGAVLQFGYAGLIMLGLILLLPTMAKWIGALLRPLMDRAFGSEGALAVDSMLQAPLRTAATVGALMIGLGFVFSTGAFIQSQKRAVSRSLNNELTSDLYVASPNLIRSRNYYFGEELGRQVATVPGVKSIGHVRITFVPYRDDRVAVIALETGAWFSRVGGEVLVEGDEARARELTPRGEGFLVSHNFASRWRIGVGDELRLETPTGPLTRPIVGSIEDYTSEKGAVLMDRALYKRYWRDDAVNFFDVNLQPGVEQQPVRLAIQRLLAGNHQAFVYTNSEYKRWIIGLVDQFFLFNYTQMIVAIFVAAIGIVNTLIISVAERKREIGVIRAIGGTRRQVRRMVLLEAVAIVIVGLAAGVLKGLLDTYFAVRTGAAVLGGYTIPYYFPWTMIAGALPVALGIALAAAWWPAQRSVRTNVIKAIGYE
jgi:putative ABC transport system permease protein